MTVNILVGAAGAPASVDITQYVDLSTLSIVDSGNQTDDTADFEILDKGLSILDMYPEGSIVVNDDSATLDEKFNGFIQHLEPRWEGIGRRFKVSCIGLSMLLDKCIIPPGRTYNRSAGSSDKQSIKWLLSTFGSPFTTAGSTDYSKIQTLDSSMEKQKFGNMTLRQAIERVLGASSESANYYIDTSGRIHTFDNDNVESDAAPYDINAAATLAADEVAPGDLHVDWDTSNLLNYYYVRGETASGSGVRSNAASIAAYGRRQAFIDGPDSDSPKKRKRLGNAALSDTKDPILRCNFRVDADYCVNGANETWRPGQLVSITSAAHGMSAQEIRIVRTTTTYLSGLGDKSIDIECGAMRANFLGPDQWGPGTSKYPDPTVVVQPADPWADPSEVARVADMDSYLLDGFDRVPPYVSGQASDSEPDKTSHRVVLPPGSDGADRTIVIFSVFLDASGTVDVPAELISGAVTDISAWDVTAHTNAGRSGDYGVGANVIRLTGDEGISNTGGYIDFTTVAVTDIDFYAILLDSADFISVVLSGGVSTADPPQLLPSGESDWDSGDDTFWLTLCADKTSVSGDPSGFSVLYVGTGAGYLTPPWRLSAMNGVGSDLDPSTYTSVGGAPLAMTFALRMKDGASPNVGTLGIGHTPTTDVTTAPWPGSTRWTPLVISGLDSVGIVGSKFRIVSSTLDARAFHALTNSDTPLTDTLYSGPWFPMLAAEWTATWDFEIDVLGSLIDANSRYFGWSFQVNDQEGRVLVRLGDSTLAEGIYVDDNNAVTDFAAVTIAAATQYRLKWGWFANEGYIRAKLYKVSETEPVAWQVEAVLAEDVADDAVTFQCILGNDGAPAQTLDLGDITMIGEPEPGQRVLAWDAGTGDGATVTWVVRPFRESTFEVWVAGILVTPASVDGAAGTFTLDRAPSTGMSIITQYDAA